MTSRGRPAPVRMYTTNTSASGPLVIHIFEPSATQPSSLRSARHAIEPMTSDPAPASLIASAPTCSPESSLGSHRSRCSFVPLAQRLCAQVQNAPRTTCRPTPRRGRAPRRSPGARGTRAPPPSTSGTLARARRGRPCSGQSRRGNASSRSIASAWARLTFANARTVSRSSSIDPIAHAVHATPRGAIRREGPPGAAVW